MVACKTASIEEDKSTAKKNPRHIPAHRRPQGFCFSNIPGSFSSNGLILKSKFAFLTDFIGYFIPFSYFCPVSITP